MNSFPSRLPTGSSSTTHDDLHHHPPPNRFSASLNRLASSSHTHSSSNSSRDLLGRLFFRISRRTRLLLFILLVFILSFYWPQLKRKSKDWSNYNRLSSNFGNPNSNPLSSDDSHRSEPTVSRTILDQLDKLQESEQLEEDQLPIDLLKEEYRKSSSHQSLVPIVTVLPTDRKQPPSTSNQDRCPDDLPSPCGFLLAGYVGEQETKAQIHVHQLGLLALALNRTLVLPQVSQSRMGSCLEYPFDLYYDSNSLHRLGIRTITHQKFVEWILGSSKLPSARLLAIVDRKQVPLTPPEGSISYDHATPNKHLLPFNPSREFCIRNDQPMRLNDPSHPRLDPKLKRNKLKLDFNSFSPLTIVGFDRWHKSIRNRNQFAQQIVDSARKSDLQTDRLGRHQALRTHDKDRPTRPDVLMINYEIRHPFLDPISEKGRALLGIDDTADDPQKLVAFQHFPYAPVWIKLAQSLLERAPAMVGVHWRQETMRIENLKRCASLLVTTLESLKHTYPSLQAIYLSTDYPIEKIEDKRLIEDLIDRSQGDDQNQRGTQAHSGTFSKLITDEHHLMMIELMNKRLPLTWFTFNSLMDSLDLSNELMDQIVELPIFNRELKDLNRMLKIRVSKDERIKGTLEIKRLIIERFKLRNGSIGEGSLSEVKEGERRGKGIYGGIGAATIDFGIIGILEKLILIRTSLFVTGIPNRCSKLSSFTHQVVQDRQSLIDQFFLRNGYLLDADSYRNPIEFNHQKTFNLIEYWG